MLFCFINLYASVDASFHFDIMEYFVQMKDKQMTINATKCEKKSQGEYL